MIIAGYLKDYQKGMIMNRKLTKNGLRVKSASLNFIYINTSFCTNFICTKNVELEKLAWKNTADVLCNII